MIITVRILRRQLRVMVVCLDKWKKGVLEAKAFNTPFKFKNFYESIHWPVASWLHE